MATMNESEYPHGASNITAEHKQQFYALVSGEFNNFALVSCFVNGEPTAAIAAVVDDGAGGFTIHPMFVAVTAGMQLVNHDNVPAADLVPREGQAK